MFNHMKAAIYSKGRLGKVLEITELEQPVPKDNEVLLRVRAASVNPLDWRMKSHRPGVDVAGEVIAVGRAVTQFKPGDAVFGAGKGTFAEYACAAETNLATKPYSVTFEQAAATPIAGLTALQGLRDKGQLQPGQKVLINGAAGGVGSFAVQIAKSFGADVTGVCSTKNVELVRSLGADRVLDYTREDFTEDRQRYNLLLDNVGNRTLSAMRSVLRPNGKCIMAGAPKKFWPVFARIFKAVARSLFLRQKFTFFIAKIKRDDLTTLCELMKAEKLTPMIDRQYPLAESSAAIAYVEEGHARAKVIITP
jgi:NADPH:quinone reductase-like Zn-dependent oxidoreductase